MIKPFLSPARVALIFWSAACVVVPCDRETEVETAILLLLVGLSRIDTCMSQALVIKSSIIFLVNDILPTSRLLGRNGDVIATSFRKKEVYIRRVPMAYLRLRV